MATTIQVPTLGLNALGIHSPFDRPDWDDALAWVPVEAAREWGAAAEASRAARARGTPPSAVVVLNGMVVGGV